MWVDYLACIVRVVRENFGQPNAFAVEDQHVGVVVIARVPSQILVGPVLQEKEENMEMRACNARAKTIQYLSTNYGQTLDTLTRLSVPNEVSA